LIFFLDDLVVFLNLSLVVRFQSIFLEVEFVVHVIDVVEIDYVFVDGLLAVVEFLFDFLFVFCDSLDLFSGSLFQFR